MGIYLGKYHTLRNAVLNVTPDVIFSKNLTLKSIGVEGIERIPRKMSWLDAGTCFSPTLRAF